MPSWPDDARLRELAAERPALSAAKIGQRMGVSRNAVIGRCYRKGIALGRYKAGRKAVTEAKQKSDASVANRLAKVIQTAIDTGKPIVAAPKPKKRKPRVRFTETGEPISRRLTVLQLEARDCRFIADGRMPWTYCGHPTVGAGIAYCAWHCRIMYTEVGYARIMGQAA